MEEEAIEENDDILEAQHNSLGKAQPLSQPKSSQKITSLDAEIKKYDEMPTPVQRMDCVEWWMKNQENFPLLSVIALDIICAPVTEVTVERLFSHLKLILTKFRSSMKPDLLDDILFLRMNDILQEAEKKINK